MKDYPNKISSFSLNNMDDEPAELTAPQMRQQALCALIMNSLPAAETEGTPRKLVRDTVHAGGMVNGQKQAWMLLQERYETLEQPRDVHFLLRSLLQPTWPRKLSVEAYQSFAQEQIRMATDLLMNPAGDTDNDKQRRAGWWPSIAEPPSNSPYRAPAARARARTNGQRESVAHRTAFIEAFLDELRCDVREAELRSTAQRRILSLTADNDQAETADVFALPASRAATAMNRKPTFQKHPCVKCGSTKHPKGFACGVKVRCEVCSSDGHIAPYCWIKHGVQLYNRRLPPAMAEQYQRWHEQYKSGTYKPMPGGPPRVRIVHKARQTTPTVTSIR